MAKKISPLWDVENLDRAWKGASINVAPEIAEKYKESFENEYLLHLKTYNVIRGRAEFYKKLLNKDKTILARYGENLGYEKLEERITDTFLPLSMKGGSLIMKLNSLIVEFPDKCLEFESLEPPFSLELMKIANWNPASYCEKMGVCMCEDKGLKPPYNYGCVEDKSLIEESESQFEERRKSQLQGISHLINSLKD